jgi:hypothetical protein
MQQKTYHSTRCRYCGWELTSPEFEPVNLSSLNGRAPEHLEEFHVKLYGHISRCADVENRQIAKIEKRAKKHADQPPPDLSAAKHQAAVLHIGNHLILSQCTAILAEFVTDDPALITMQDGARWMLHQATRKFHCTDEMIRDRLQRLALSPKGQAAVFELVAELRDVLEERGLYEPGKEGAEIATAAARTDAAIAGRP